MIGVDFYGGRWLGARCLEELNRKPDIGVDVQQFTSTGWWGEEPQPATRPWPGKPELGISVLTSHIFTPDEIASYPLGIINLHPAPLPGYRGCNSYAHAIMNGERYYGVTLHYIDEGIDTGPIIAQSWLAIDHRHYETGGVLYDRAQCAAFNLFRQTLPEIEWYGSYGARVPSRPQDESRAHYYRRDSLKDKSLLGLEYDARMKKQRALDFPPFPPAHYR